MIINNTFILGYRCNCGCYNKNHITWSWHISNELLVITSILLWAKCYQFFHPNLSKYYNRNAKTKCSSCLYYFQKTWQLLRSIVVIREELQLNNWVLISIANIGIQNKKIVIMKYYILYWDLFLNLSVCIKMYAV